MYARYISFKRALPGADFMLFDSGKLKRKRIPSFSRQTKKALLMSTLIEDNFDCIVYLVYQIKNGVMSF